MLELVQEVESSSREETVHACNACNACIRSVRNNASTRFIIRITITMVNVYINLVPSSRDRYAIIL